MPLDYAAQRCGVSIHTVRRWVRAGVFPVVRLAEGPGARPRLRVDPAEVERWVEDRTSRPGPQDEREVKE